MYLLIRYQPPPDWGEADHWAYIALQMLQLRQPTSFHTCLLSIRLAYVVVGCVVCPRQIFK